MNVIAWRINKEADELFDLLNRDMDTYPSNRKIVTSNMWAVAKELTDIANAIRDKIKNGDNNLSGIGKNYLIDSMNGLKRDLEDNVIHINNKIQHIKYMIGQIKMEE